MWKLIKRSHRRWQRQPNSLNWVDRRKCEACMKNSNAVRVYDFTAYAVRTEATYFLKISCIESQRLPLIDESYQPTVKVNESPRNTYRSVACVCAVLDSYRSVVRPDASNFQTKVFIFFFFSFSSSYLLIFNWFLKQREREKEKQANPIFFFVCTTNSRFFFLSFGA